MYMLQNSAHKRRLLNFQHVFCECSIQFSIDKSLIQGKKGSEAIIIMHTDW